MKKGLLTRIIINDILSNLYTNNLEYDVIFKKKIKENRLEEIEKKFIQNTVLTSLRQNFVVKEIISIYLNKKQIKKKEYLLLLSAVTQLIFLNIKEYAVINCTVEIAKILNDNINSKFINAILRKIAKNKLLLQNKKSKFISLPLWFRNEVEDWQNNTKQIFLKTIKEIPDLHIVFKDKKKVSFFNSSDIKTTNQSIIIKSFNKISNLPNYNEGDWWVQDFSAMLPIYLLENIENKLVLDMCAAPGGKTFQIISRKAHIDIYERDKNRANILKKNLERLKFTNKINISDSLKIKNINQYDVVLLDAPCSSVGTVRRNPDIFFHNSKININYYVSLQMNLLKKAGLLVKPGGKIIYMVCSFLKAETTKQVNNFLKNNKNFTTQSFPSNEFTKGILNKQGFIETIPQKFQNKFFIDGFFSAILKRND